MKKMTLFGFGVWCIATGMNLGLSIAVGMSTRQLSWGNLGMAVLSAVIADLYWQKLTS